MTKFMSGTGKMAMMGMLLAGALISEVNALSATPQAAPVKKNVSLAGPAASPSVHRKTLRATGLSPHARDYFLLNWGVDSLSVRSVESGSMIRFSYFVLDATKAAALNDKKLNPTLVDERARVSLAIPSMENVGQLRQSSTAESGKSYWMVFSNKGGVVKPGDLVSVQIGKFHVDGLQVE
jgi:hypothetical protein